jgi:AraC-like DNA-binding protein
MVILIYFMVSFWFRSKGDIYEWHQTHVQAARIRDIFIPVFFNAQYLFYCIWLMIMLNGIKKNKQILLHSVFNNFLLKITIYLYAGGWFLSFATIAIGLFRLMPGFDFNFLNILYFYFFFLFLFYITVKGFNTKEVFKYSNSDTDHNDLVKLYEKITQTTVANEPFLEPSLSLKQFADSINEDPRIVSQAINHVFGSNFNDFMNYHRVELAKKMLGGRLDMTIQEVMYQSGFNSKATFNKVFKKIVDKTPTQYRQETR